MKKNAAVCYQRCDEWCAACVSPGRFQRRARLVPYLNATAVPCADHCALADVGLTRFVRILNAPNFPLQVGELAVLTATNVNVALNKPCTATPPYSSNTVCSNAFDGTYAAQPLNSLYHSEESAVTSFLLVDLGANFKIAQVDFYNRLASDCCAERAIGSVVELLDANNVVLARRTITTSAWRTSLTFSLMSTPSCESTLEDGAWWLVRRAVDVFSTTTDRLFGTFVEGTYGTQTSASSFSVSFAAALTSSTEFLFMTGAFSLDAVLFMQQLLVCSSFPPNRRQTKVADHDKGQHRRPVRWREAHHPQVKFLQHSVFGNCLNEWRFGYETDHPCIDNRHCDMVQPSFERRRPPHLHVCAWG